MTVANNIWNKLNPWSACDQDMAILDPYTMAQLLLEMECNTQDHSQFNIKRQAISEMKLKLETAIEIIDQLAPVLEIYLLEIYLAEQVSPYDETPNLYMTDYYGVQSMHIKCLPCAGGSGFVTVSYQSYVSYMDSLNPDTKIPTWASLQDYFVNGIYVLES
jgi:hypothetical protein